jgi:methylated-DNA-[protein]-cysteine S-methyltransferase
MSKHAATSEPPVSYAYLDTPVGRVLVAGDAGHLRLIAFQQGSRIHHPQPGWRHDPAPFAEVFRQLDDYFAGRRVRFTLPLHLGGTDFQNAVWTSLQAIPYGSTITYRDLAARVGKPAAIRAAGAANGANPLPIVVPCHRVIGSNGSLTGFGGGIEAKQFLLAHEQTFGAADLRSERARG